MEPLALEYLSAGLKGDHDVKLLDLRFDDNLEGVLKDFVPDIVGTTGYTVHVKRCKDILKKVKLFDKSAITVVGGHHATVAPQDFYEPDIDIVVIGEGVFAMKEIAETLGKKGDLKKINGLVIHENGKFHKTKARTDIELDNLPFPDRSLNAERRKRYCLGTEKPVALLRTSLGCAFKCIYCAQWKISGGKYLTREPKFILGELSTIEEPYIFFADDEAFLDADRMMELAMLIKGAGIKKKYHLYARADTISKHPNLIEAWKEIGLSYVAVGFEAFSDRELEYLNKSTSVNTNEMAIKVLKENNIVVYANFIVRPDFNREDFRRLKNYVREKKLYNPKFPIFTPFPGTAYYESVKSELTSDDYELYDFKHALVPTKLSSEEFYQEYIRIQKYAVPRMRAYIDLIKRPLTGIIPLFLTRKKSIAKMRKSYRLD
jgi:radical SAM superfamily enzyme YgiQ (UPF0313 family)